MGKWEDIAHYAAKGDSAFIEQQYDVSAERYREALQLLSDMEISIPDVLKNALESEVINLMATKMMRLQVLKLRWQLMATTLFLKQGWIGH